MNKCGKSENENCVNKQKTKKHDVSTCVLLFTHGNCGLFTANGRRTYYLHNMRQQYDMSSWHTLSLAYQRHDENSIEFKPHKSHQDRLCACLYIPHIFINSMAELCSFSQWKYFFMSIHFRRRQFLVQFESNEKEDEEE